METANIKYKEVIEIYHMYFISVLKKPRKVFMITITI